QVDLIDGSGDCAMELTSAVDGGTAETDLASVVTTTGTMVQLRVQIPRVLWSVPSSSTIASFGGTEVVVWLDELTDGVGRSLVVRTGMPGIEMRLLVRDAQGAVVQESAMATASGVDGRWVFPLAQFADTLRYSGASHASLELALDGLLP